MRALLHSAISACLLAAAPVVAPPFAWAQSSQDLTRALELPQGAAGKTRGIRPSAPPAETTATAPETTGTAPPPAARPPAHAMAGQPMVAAPGSGEVSITVEFRTGSAQLSPSAMRVLNSLGGALSSPRLAGYRFRIEGHTDTVGSADLNKALSEERANAVVDYLVTKFNIDRGRLTPAGMGEDGLLIQTPPDTAEPRNRRVQVVNVGT